MSIPKTDSILKTIRIMLGPDVDYDAFDTDLIININSSLMTLMQLGVGPEKGFVVYDENQTWTDFIGDATNLESVKLYVYIKAKLIFDPPPNSFVVSAYEKQATELEWRLNHEAERTEHNATQ